MREVWEPGLLKVGELLPAWHLNSIFGDAVPDRGDYLGQPLLILFFSLGCPGCLGRAIPYANRLVYENGDKLQVLGIHTNYGRHTYTQAQFENAREAYYLRFPFYEDRDFDTTFMDYGGVGTPHWILADKNGVVVYTIFGSDPNNALLRLEYSLGALMELG